MLFDIPPPLIIPEKPALIRAATPDLLLPNQLPRKTRRALASAKSPAEAMLIVNQLAGFGAGGSSPPSYTYNTRSIHTANNATNTFTALDIGAADPTRFVIIGIAVYAAGVGQNVSSVTIGGITATLLAGIRDTGSDARSMFYGALVPTGTTADVIITAAGTWQNCAVSSYSLYNLTSTTPFATATSQASPCSLNANTTADAIVLAMTMTGVQNGITTTWVGVTERSGFDEQVETALGCWSGADGQMTSAETPRTFSATFSVTPNDGKAGALIVMK